MPLPVCAGLAHELRSSMIQSRLNNTVLLHSHSYMMTTSRPSSSMNSLTWMHCDAFSAFNARRSPGLSGADLQPIYWAKTPQVNVVQYIKDFVRRFIQKHPRRVLSAQWYFSDEIFYSHVLRFRTFSFVAENGWLKRKELLRQRALDFLVCISVARDWVTRAVDYPYS